MPHDEVFNFKLHQGFFFFLTKCSISLVQYDIKAPV